MTCLWRLFTRISADPQYDEEQWVNTIAQPLCDLLREKQRTALVAYLVTHPDQAQGRYWHTSDDLYAHFLIDVEMSPCQMTSRIKQAMSSTQLFVQRCLMNLEPEVMASTEVDSHWRQWTWMKSYRVWEANREIFLYPENWIEPELRDDKSPFFKELESELQQSSLTKESAETACQHYLEKLDAVAHLEIVSLYQQQEYDAVGNLVIDILHPAGATDTQSLTFALTAERFPFLSQGRHITLGAFEVFVQVEDAFAGTHNTDTLTFALVVGNSASTPITVQPSEMLSLALWNGVLRGEKAFGSPPGNWTISGWLTGGAQLDPNAIKDIVVVCHYTVV